MSVETLNRSLDTAFQRLRRAPETSKAHAPWEYSSGVPSESAYGGDLEQEQYAHYRGRVYTAVRPIVQRIAGRPAYCARRGVLNTERRLSTLVQKSAVPLGGVPEWLGNLDDIELYPVHPLLAALDDPNDLMTRWNMWEMAIASLCVTGRGFLVAFPSQRKDRQFDPFPVPATWMRPRGKSFREWLMRPPSSNQNPIPISGDAVAHFYFADPSNPLSAISPLQMLARPVLSDEAIASAQHSAFKNGGLPQVALIAGDVMNETALTEGSDNTTSARPIKLEPYQRRQIISWFKQEYLGVQKQGLPMVLDAVIRDIKILNRKPAEMSFLESSTLTKEQIFEGYGVPEVTVGQFGNVNRASAAISDQILCDNVLNPIITLVSLALTKKFGPLYSVGGEQLMCWLAPCQSRDPELELEWWRLGVRSYSVERNDMRRKLGLPPKPGMDDVVMPQTLEEREADEDRVGIGRLPFLSGVDGN